MNMIPSDEELDRASKMMEQQFHNLDVVKQNIIGRFKSNCPLFDFRILPQGEDGFRAYTFFNQDKDIEQCKLSGTTSAIEDAVYEELERVGRGKRGETVVAFEWDSDENVDNNYDGDYLLRLR